jgi:hypothetical protein
MSVASCENKWIELFAESKSTVHTYSRDKCRLGFAVNLNAPLCARRETLGTALVKSIRQCVVDIDPSRVAQLVQLCDKLLTLLQDSHSMFPLHPQCEGRHLLAVWVDQFLSVLHHLDPWPDLVAAMNRVTQWLVDIRVFDPKECDLYVVESEIYRTILFASSRAGSNGILTRRGCWNMLAILSPRWNHERLVSRICNMLLTISTIYYSDVHAHAWWWLDTYAHLVSPIQASEHLASHCLINDMPWSTALATRVRLALFFLSRCSASIELKNWNHPILCLLDASATNSALAQRLSIHHPSGLQLGPLVWLDSPLVLMLSDPGARTCARLWWTCWNSVYCPQLQALLEPHLILDVVNLVLDALTPSPCRLAALLEP